MPKTEKNTAMKPYKKQHFSIDVNIFMYLRATEKQNQKLI